MNANNLPRWIRKSLYGHLFPVCGWFWCGYPLTFAEQQMSKCPLCRRDNQYRKLFDKEK